LSAVPPGELRLDVWTREGDAGDVRCRVIDDSGVLRFEGHAIYGAAEPQPAPVGSELRAVLDRRGKPQNGPQLLAALGRGHHAAALTRPVVWAHASRFDEVVGAMRLSESAAIGEPALVASVL